MAYRSFGDGDVLLGANSVTPKTDTVQGLDVVEEALPFGWIDNIGKKTPDGILAVRIAPRKKNSNWTELNKARVRRLEKL